VQTGRNTNFDDVERIRCIGVKPDNIALRAVMCAFFMRETKTAQFRCQSALNMCESLRGKACEYHGTGVLATDVHKAGDTPAGNAALKCACACVTRDVNKSCGASDVTAMTWCVVV